MTITMKIYYLSSLVMASSVGAKTVKCPVGSSNRGSKPGNDYWISWYCWQPRASETKMEFVSQLSELPIYLRPWVPLRTWQIQNRCWEYDQGCSLLAGSSGRGVENGEDKIMIIAMMTATQMTKKWWQTQTRWCLPCRQHERFRWWRGCLLQWSGHSWPSPPCEDEDEDNEDEDQVE